MNVDNLKLDFNMIYNPTMDRYTTELHKSCDVDVAIELKFNSSTKLKGAMQ